jgi:hypothetical protein
MSPYRTNARPLRLVTTVAVASGSCGFGFACGLFVVWLFELVTRW